MKTKQQFRTKTIKVDPRWVGLIIGKGGATIKGLAKQSGDSCRILHDRSNPGKFDMSARTSQELLRAEINIKKLIQSKQETKTVQKKQRSRHQTTATSTRHQPGSRTKNSFSLLSNPDKEVTPSYTPALEMDGCQLLSKREEEDLFSGKKSTHTDKRHPKSKKHTKTLNVFFRDDGSIKKRKHAKWLNHHASEEDKAKHLARQKRYNKEKTPPTPSIIFPNLSHQPPPAEEEVKGVWGETTKMDKIKAPKSITPPASPNAFDNLQKIIKGEKKEKKFEITIPTAPRKMQPSRPKGIYEDDNALEENFDPKAQLFEDEEEWSEGECEYGRFDDEEDHTLLACA
jgi:hypothetical protein